MCQVDITCEECSTPASLQCADGEVLHIVSAVYGRTSSEVCLDTPSATNTIGCVLDVISSVRDLCEGGNACEVPSCNVPYGDPCRGTYKYLETHYVCGTPEALLAAGDIVCPAAETTTSTTTTSTATTLATTTTTESSGTPGLYFGLEGESCDGICSQQNLSDNNGSNYINSAARLNAALVVTGADPALCSNDYRRGTGIYAPGCEFARCCPDFMTTPGYLCGA